MSGPLIFTDFHHTSLLKSLIFLFEKRLGGAVYRPIGMEWMQQGFWKINDQEDTARQFLMERIIPTDGTPALNQVQPNYSQMFSLCEDPEMPGEYIKAITLEQFRQLPIDYVIATIPQHILPFKKLIEEYKPLAKLIVQVGNSWSMDELPADNILASALINNAPASANIITYHQEFDRTIFRPENWIALGLESPLITTPKQSIYSFINILQNTTDFSTFQQLEQRLTDWDFKSYGGQCRDGCITGSRNLAETMRKARFIYHLKSGGDGYGHVLHNALACGRPVIYKASDYAGKLGEQVLMDGISGINIEGLSIDGMIEKIQHYNQEVNYRNLCRNTYRLFEQVIDFDKEEQEIRLFLQRLR